MTTEYATATDVAIIDGDKREFKTEAELLEALSELIESLGEGK